MPTAEKDAGTNVRVHLLSQSQPIERRAVNTYTKDGMFCLYLADGTVEKYPLVNIFRVVEPYVIPPGVT